MYKNPVISGFYPDPSVCRVDDDFYLVTSSFEYFPGIPIFKSKNLINWEQIGYCISRDNQIDLTGTPNSGGIFAPTIRYNNGILYVITTNITQGNFFVYSENFGKTWSDPIWIDISGIDPSLYFENGKTYVQFAAFGQENSIKQVEIDILTGKILVGPNTISYGSGGRDLEAPHMVFKDNFYYLFAAEGGTREGHMVTVRRSDSIYGPFEEYNGNPILSNRDKGNEPIQSVGHVDVFEDQFGDWWGVCLGTRPNKRKTNLGRETLLLPVYWNEEGWPVIYKGFAEEYIEIDRNLVRGVEQQTKNSIVGFVESGRLSYHWNSLRENINDKVNLDYQNDKLTVSTSPTNLDSTDKVSFVCRRQVSIDFEVECKVNFQPNLEDEAGLAIYIDNNHFYSINKTTYMDKDVIVLRYKLSEIDNYKHIEINDVDSLYFKITGDKKYYYFYYSYNGEDFCYISKVNTKYLSIEVSDSPFTGAFIGLYASSNGKGNQNYATFTKFKYLDITTN